MCASTSNGEMRNSFEKYSHAMTVVVYDCFMFFGKEKYVGTIACLMKTQYLDSLQRIIELNLGIAYLSIQYYVSAFRYSNSVITQTHYLLFQMLLILV